MWYDEDDAQGVAASTAPQEVWGNQASGLSATPARPVFTMMVEVDRLRRLDVLFSTVGQADRVIGRGRKCLQLSVPKNMND